MGGGAWCEEELVAQSDDDDSTNWDFANAPGDFYVNVCPSFYRDLDAIRELGRSAIVAVAKYASRVFSLPLRNLNSIMQRNFGVAAKAVVLERVCVI